MSKKKESLAERLMFPALIGGMIATFVAMFIFGLNCDRDGFNYSSAALVVSSSLFVGGLLLSMAACIVETVGMNKDKPLIKKLSIATIVCFFLSVIFLTRAFACVVFDEFFPSKAWPLTFLILGLATGITGIVFRLYQKKNEKSTSIARVIKQDARDFKDTFLPTPSFSFKDFRSYRYKDRTIQSLKDNKQKYEETRRGGQLLDYNYYDEMSWPTIWLISFFLSFVMWPILILKLKDFSKEYDSKTKERLILYLIYCIVVSILFFPLLVPGGWFALMYVLLAPVINVFISIYYLIHSPQKYKRYYKKLEDCKSLICKDRITDINLIADKLDVSYDKALGFIDTLISKGKINNAFINYYEEEIVVMGINDKFAVKCDNCGGTTVLKKNAEKTCRWCGAEL